MSSILPQQCGLPYHRPFPPLLASVWEELGGSRGGCSSTWATITSILPRQPYYRSLPSNNGQCPGRDWEAPDEAASQLLLSYVTGYHFFSFFVVKFN